MDDILVADTKKNGREVIRIQLREYQGHRFVDLRLYYDAGNGEMRPTGKGFGLKADLIGNLQAALEQAEAEVQRQGLIKNATARDSATGT